ncbi:MAG: hypothetical protein AB7U35_10195 [Sphingobium sp.]
MNEFVPRIDSVTAERPAPVVRSIAAVQPSNGRPDGAGQGDLGADSGEQARRDHMASVFDYARVQARIAKILAEIDTSSIGLPAQQEADARIEALRPEPMVIIPLPPASLEAIENAVRVARAMVEKAALTRTAQANVELGTVNQMLAASA